ncbi:hypothetical protein NPIL_481261 [Nephila pilipes]|uniref:Uncharacterized protein n=1 Tax=Nephila pilipes TaxID=299642 RepID=A0A8X6TP79_NEPPI|nr:hypothetical protein NPIL_481261 [Nephila pilipes]
MTKRKARRNPLTCLQRKEPTWRPGASTLRDVFSVVGRKRFQHCSFYLGDYLSSCERVAFGSEEASVELGAEVLVKLPHWLYSWEQNRARKSASLSMGHDPTFFNPVKTQEAQLEHFVTQCEEMFVPCLGVLPPTTPLDEDYYLVIGALNENNCKPPRTEQLKE